MKEKQTARWEQLMSESEAPHSLELELELKRCKKARRNVFTPLRAGFSLSTEFFAFERNHHTYVYILE